MKKVWLWIMTLLTAFCLFACTKPGDPPPTTYTVTIVNEDATFGEVTGGGTFEENTTVTVSATEKEGYAFLGWYEGAECVSMDKTYAFTLSRDRNLTARWYSLPPVDPPVDPPTTYTVTIINEDETRGTISGAGTFEEGAKATLTATPVDGYGFLGWYEDGKKTTKNASYTFTVTASRTLVARWYKLGNTGGWSGAV